MVFKIKPGIPTYRAMHIRLRKHCGKAKNYRCITCGAPAQEWACFRNKTLTGVMRGKVLMYSQRLEDYAPLCRRCHRDIDAARGEERRDAVLTDEIVIDLRTRAASKPLNRTAEALRLGITAGTVSKVLRGDSWKHLPVTNALTTPPRRGEAMTNAILTDEIVLDLRERHRTAPLNMREEARKLGVSEHVVWQAVTGRSWKHLL